MLKSTVTSTFSEPDVQYGRRSYLSGVLLGYRRESLASLVAERQGDMLLSRDSAFQEPRLMSRSWQVLFGLVERLPPLPPTTLVCNVMQASQQGTCGFAPWSDPVPPGLHP
jgi:hypothetical protein